MLLIFITLGILAAIILLMLFQYSFLFFLKIRYERKRKLKNKKILIIAFNGMEDIEFTVPYDIWQREGYDVCFASLNDEDKIKTKYNLELSNPKKLSSITLKDYDVLFLPGGSGVKIELNNPRLDSVINHFYENDKWIAAICASPQFLAVRNYLKDKKVIGFQDNNNYDLLEKHGAIVNRKCVNNSMCEVEVDGKIITGMNFQSANVFAHKVVELINNE